MSEYMQTKLILDNLREELHTAVSNQEKLKSQSVYAQTIFTFPKVFSINTVISFFGNSHLLFTMT